MRARFRSGITNWPWTSTLGRSSSRVGRRILGVTTAVSSEPSGTYTVVYLASRQPRTMLTERSWSTRVQPSSPAALTESEARL